jgi:hypothetical protein
MAATDPFEGGLDVAGGELRDEAYAAGVAAGEREAFESGYRFG